MRLTKTQKSSNMCVLGLGGACMRACVCVCGVVVVVVVVARVCVCSVFFCFRVIHCQ